MNATSRMPALYIGHGAPPLLDDPVWSGQLHSLAADLPRPTAILIVSAHWESAPLALSTSGPGVGLVYDFGGFPERYYRMTYQTPAATALADRVVEAMQAAANTGAIGDGKIFVLDVGQAVRIRTGETDANAL